MSDYLDRRLAQAQAQNAEAKAQNADTTARKIMLEQANVARLQAVRDVERIRRDLMAAIKVQSDSNSAYLDLLLNREED